MITQKEIHGASIWQRRLNYCLWCWQLIVLIPDPADPFIIQFSANVPGKTADNSSSAWAAVTICAGFWSQPVTARDTVAI